MAEKKKYGDIEFNDQQMEEFRLVVPKYQVGVKINFFPSQFSHVLKLVDSFSGGNRENV